MSFWPRWPPLWSFRCTAWFPGILPCPFSRGWHSTIFAPYFVAGAIHSGLAMVLILLIPLRRIYKFENIITMETLENIAKTIILTGLIMGYSYLTEHFISWYSGNNTEKDTFYWRMVGYYKEWFWLMVFSAIPSPPCFTFLKKSGPTPSACMSSPSWWLSACGMSVM